ncbi:peptidoglycan-binding domain-containing protein [Pseudanabaena sp. ABRG5-3]|uniref:peptidoglycan-binding domain-containing protein n=1 Tax=Pseudanabaena sp. ABRG5-3 TaxID=685565 RepID=UPI000DC71D3B|nr:peptidoglycan-binding protein [Pseudanabaena sp. ABRG5-3]BBC26081.1 peptidoglycan-binding domain 1 protein [Pseudanabaena sp. ABRG5-3]
MELAAYIYDAWAYEQAHQESPDADLLTLDEIDNPQCQVTPLVWNSMMKRWRSYLLSAIAITGMNSFSLSFGQPIEASQYLEPSVNAPPWCENLYLCNTRYVLEVQTLLAKRGFAVGEIDGVYGRQTKSAVTAFQKSQANLVVDGIPGEQTLALLKNPSQNILPVPNKNQPTGQDINKSSSVKQVIIVRPISPSNVSTIEGSEIGNLQILLKQRGFYQGEIDGRQGQTTVNAILKAQQAYGLIADGFAGPLTIRALLAGGTNVPLSLTAFNQPPTTQDVLAIQQLLKARGFYDAELNGLYDLRTKDSIVNAQNAYGQKATGELSPELIASLKGQTMEPIAVQNVSTMQNNPNSQDIRPSPTVPSNIPSSSNTQKPTSSQNLPSQSPQNTNSS